jgi:hypothetical protein
MDRMQAPPRNAFIGGLADLLAAGTSPQRTQQMRGLMEFLQVPDIAQTLDRVSYGEPLTTGRGMTTKLRPEAESTLMAALGMLPAGRPAEAGAMALGRAGERMAERVVPQVMERGGLPAEMLSAMAQGTQSPATVFHGSPHLFQRFDSSKIGTGEGNQTYGYGLYLAENPAVARDYKQALSEPEVFVGGKKLQPKAGSPDDVASAWLQDVFDRGFFESKTANPFDQAIADIQKAPVPDKEAVIQAVKDLKAKGATMRPGGNVYQVDLPDEQIAKMLDYDKPLNKQAKPVREALSKLGITVDDTKLGEYEDALLGALMSDAPTGPLPRQPVNMTGGEILKELQRNPSRYLPQVMQGRELTQAMINPDQGASSVLRQAGIPGIRYLDQGSRATSGGELLDVFKTPSGWKSKIKVTNRGGVGFESPTDTVTTSMPFKTEDEARQWAQSKIGGGTSNFVVFPGMEDMLRIEQINEQPINSLLQTLGR